VSELIVYVHPAVVEISNFYSIYLITLVCRIHIIHAYTIRKTGGALLRGSYRSE